MSAVGFLSALGQRQAAFTSVGFVFVLWGVFSGSSSEYRGFVREFEEGILPRPQKFAYDRHFRWDDVGTEEWELEQLPRIDRQLWLDRVLEDHQNGTCIACLPTSFGLVLVSESLGSHRAPPPPPPGSVPDPQPQLRAPATNKRKLFCLSLKWEIYVGMSGLIKFMKPMWEEIWKMIDGRLYVQSNVFLSLQKLFKDAMTRVVKISEDVRRLASGSLETLELMLLVTGKTPTGDVEAFTVDADGKVEVDDSGAGLAIGCGAGIWKRFVVEHRHEDHSDPGVVLLACNAVWEACLQRPETCGGVALWAITVPDQLNNPDYSRVQVNFQEPAKAIALQLLHHGCY